MRANCASCFDTKLTQAPGNPAKGVFLVHDKSQTFLVIPKVLQLVLTARATRKNKQPIVVIFIVVVVRSN